MKNIKIKIFILFFLISLSAFSQKVSTFELYLASKNFSKNNADFSSLKLKEIQPLVDFNDTIGYVASFSPYGFIVFTPDKQNDPIKAFSADDNFDFKKSNNNILLEMLISDLGCLYTSTKNISPEEKKSVIENIEKWDKLINGEKTKVTIAQYGAWIPSVWGGVNCKDEDSNYIYVGNYFTPNHYSPGCVATSLSQILYRYKWPRHGLGFHTDYDNSGSSQGSYYANFCGTFYDWENMLDEYYYKASTDIQRRANGQLQLHCGIAVDMDYEYDGSTSNVNRSPYALATYFRYTGHYEDISWSSFWSRLDQNLENGHPVQLAIKADNGAGHAIACDGYRLTDEGDKYYHLNMGWWGTCNAWYRISVSFNSCGYTSVTGGVFDILPEPELVTSDFKRTCDKNSYYVTWHVSPEISYDAFELQQSADGGSTWTTLSNTITDTFYLVTVDDPSIDYYYRVRAKYDGYWYLDSYSNIAAAPKDLIYIDLDGDDSFYVNDNSDNDLDVTTDWTFELWINADGLPVSYPVILDRRYSYSMYILADTGPGDYAVKFVARDANDYIIASVSSDANEDLYFGNWYHVAVSRDGATTRLFVNGKLVDSSTDPDFEFSPSIKTLNFGARYWSSGYERYFDGKFDEIRISKIARYTSDFIPDRYSPPIVDNYTCIQLDLNEGTSCNIFDAANNFTNLHFRNSPNSPNWMYDFYATEWTGSTSSDWNDATNWSDGLPNIYSNVRIEDSTVTQPIISSSVDVKNIWLGENTEITVQPDQYLFVHGRICNDGTLTLETKDDSTHSGALIDTGNVSGSGHYIAKRYLSAGQWHFISSPVNYGQVTSEQFTATGNPFNKNFLWYDETDTTDDWMNGWSPAYQSTSTPDTLNVMQGYAFYHPDSNLTATFSGTFNTGTIRFNTTYTPAEEVFEHEGWNFIGNPYPSAIDWDSPNGWDKNNIDNSVYYWNGLNYSYYVGTSGNVYGTGVNNGTNIIPSMQGFMVKATTDGYIEINNNARTTNTYDFYKNKAQTNIIKLSCIYKSNKDQTAIRLLDEANDFYDNKFDAIKLFNDIPLYPQVYSFDDSIEYAINSLNSTFDNKSINIGLWAPENGNYTFVIDEISLQTENKAILLDTYTDKYTELSANITYSFYSDAGNIKDRFKLIFNTVPTEISLNNNADAQIYSFNHTLYIKLNNKDMAYLNIYDINGRLLIEKIITTENYSQKLNFNDGVYIAKVKTNETIVTKKIILK